MMTKRHGLIVVLSFLAFTWFSIVAPATQLSRFLRSAPVAQASGSTTKRGDVTPNIPQEEEINAHPDRSTRSRMAFSAPPPKMGSGGVVVDPLLAGRTYAALTSGKVSTKVARQASRPLFLVNLNLRA